MVSRRSILRKKRYAEDPEYRAKNVARSRRYRAAHKEQLKERERLARYGLTQADYDAMLARQGGVCAICRKKSDRPLQIDHCHKTGMVRGLLCLNCNTALGRLHDDPDLMRAAIAYLEASRRDVDEVVGGSGASVDQDPRYGKVGNDVCAPAAHRPARRKRSAGHAGAPSRFQTVRRPEASSPVRRDVGSREELDPAYAATGPPSEPRRCRAAGSAGRGRRIR
jgi:hypothetical protein